MPCSSSGWGLIRSWGYEFVGSVKDCLLDVNPRSAAQRLRVLATCNFMAAQLHDFDFRSAAVHWFRKRAQSRLPSSLFVPSA